ncbi:MAG: hypothetical protein QM736_01190 [Vicinamibacterales bacterium]
MKAILLGLALLWSADPAHAQNRPWPSESAPRPLPARESTFPAYENPHVVERHAGRGGAAPRAAGDQHADDRPGRRRAGPAAARPDSQDWHQRSSIRG